jgi:predicted transposase/invertase (TIGR01784 family)
MRDRTKTKYSDHLNLIFVELPKFLKQKEELETQADYWIYSLKNTKYLSSKPQEIQGKIFEKLYDILEINQLTPKEMETYDKSILKYRDVRSAVELAGERAYEKGMKMGIEKGMKKGIEKRNYDIAYKLLELKIPVMDIVKATGLSPEQIMEL